MVKYRCPVGDLGSIPNGCIVIINSITSIYSLNLGKTFHVIFNSGREDLGANPNGWILYYYKYFLII